MSTFILVIVLYGGDGPFLKLVEGFSTMENCAKAAQVFNGFVQNKDTKAMAFCMEKNKGGFMLDILASVWLLIVRITPWLLAYFIYKGAVK